MNSQHRPPPPEQRPDRATRVRVHHAIAVVLTAPVVVFLLEAAPRAGRT